jgi:penicillin amidase
VSGIGNAIAAARRVDIDPLWLLRIFTVAPVLLILLAGGGALWTYFFVLSLLPEHVTSVELPGLAAEVKVARDGKGVPSIVCENESDGASVLGYVTAQDRLWQMDYLRRAARGRLAEIMGRSYLESDRLMRAIITERAIANDVRGLPKDARKFAEQYVRGVNLFIKERASNTPIEFSLLEYAPQPFTVEDGAAVLLAFALAASPAITVDPALTGILGKLGKEKAARFFPQDPAATGAIRPSPLEGWVPSGPLFTSESDALQFPGPRGGCCWARVSEGDPPSRASAGMVLYQRLQAPSFWYRARLVINDRILSGSYMPGVPFPHAASNSRLAYGCVPAPADDADLFVESVDSDEPRNYWRDGVWKPLRETVEAYEVKRRATETAVVRSTENGPLVSEVKDGFALSLKWTGREGVNFPATLFALSRATTGAEVKDALRELVGPPMHVVWAATDGTAGVQFAGRVPVRPSGFDGVTPAPGWTSACDWAGFIPFEALPEQHARPRRPAVTSDDKAGGPDYPLFMGLYWSSGGRTERLKTVLGEIEGSGAEAFGRVWADNSSPLAAEFTPILMAARPAQEGNDLEDHAYKLLTAWDLKTSAESPAAAIFALWLQAMMDRLFRSELGAERFAHYAERPALALGRLAAFLKAHDTNESDPAQFVRQCFTDAVKTGRALMGADPARWRWGDIHRTLFTHPLSVKSSLMGVLYKAGPHPAAGSRDTVDMADWDQLRPFDVVEGASLRQGWVMNDPPESVAVIPLGVSAHFFSGHYKDQTEAWRQGRMFMDPRDSAAIGRSAAGTVTFRPARVTAERSP